MATKKKNSPPKQRAASTLKPLQKMKDTHAGMLIGKVNNLISEQGFAAHVNELHLVPSNGDSLDCGNCPPPAVCKRVCFINDEGQPECEDRCVGADGEA
jgi:hypothetical protein